MANFVSTDSHGAGGDACLQAPVPGVFAEPLSAAGAIHSDDDPHALVIPDDAAIYVLNTSHYRAKLFIPCLVGRCPGRMQLHFLDKFNQPLQRAFYRCEREGCYHREEVVFPEDLNARYVMEAGKKRYYKSDEARTRDEMETMV